MRADRSASVTRHGVRGRRRRVSSFNRCSAATSAWRSSGRGRNPGSRFRGEEPLEVAAKLGPLFRVVGKSAPSPSCRRASVHSPSA